MQVPCVHKRTHHVVTSMNNHRRNVSNAIDVFDQVVVSLEETVVHEVVTLDSRDCERFVGFGELIDETLVWKKFQRTGFPLRPRFRRFETHRLIVARQPSIIGADHVAAFSFRNQAQVRFPVVWEYRARALTVFIKPANLFWPAQKDSAQDQSAHSFRMRLRVSERQRATPRSAEYEPLIDTEVFADLFDVLDQMLGRVVVE